MQVSQLNNVSVYNLSSGKSLPEWLSERKRRQLQNQNVDIRRRVELIQDFDMPTSSSNIKVSKDLQYILATGVYKPRVKCYDVNQLSLKFERCFDSDVVQFEVLSDDFSKMIFLQSDRHVEFHAQYGRYYRTRIPNFGRDLCYHSTSCDLYMVGACPEIFRLNLEQGRFLQPYQTSASEVNVCEINAKHELLVVGTKEGRVECFDPRSRTRVGVLDIGTSGLSVEIMNDFPSVTALKFNDSLEIGLGLSTGHILLYDIRSDKPLLVKDHQNGLPIKDMLFHPTQNKVLSADQKVVKIWERDSGRIFTSVEPNAPINNLCLYPNSGLIFTALEAEKMGIFYIPELGQAPRWCSFLDRITEELEESKGTIIYDDYKFVTKQDLDSLGLSHLMGTNLLRAYMHGYFIDIRLYHKAISIVEPFAYEKYRRNKIKEKIEEERANRIKVNQLPKVNRQLAEKLIDEDEEKSSKKSTSIDFKNPLKDDRFAVMFTNPDFQVDEESEEYKLLHPVISKKEKDRKKCRKEQAEDPSNDIDTYENAYNGQDSSDEEDFWKDVEYHRKMRKEESNKESVPQLYELNIGDEPMQFSKKVKPKKPWSFGEILDETEDKRILKEKGVVLGSKEITFKLKKSETETKRQKDLRDHKLERKKLRRSAGSLQTQKKSTPVFWRGKRVK